MKRLEIGRPEQSLALWGLRGVGKTVLLNDFAREAETAGWATGYTELSARGPLRPHLAGVVQQAASQLIGRDSLRDRMHRLMGVVKSFSITAMPTGVTFSLEADPALGRADSGQLDVDIADVMTELGEAARSEGVGVALFVDEMQFAPLEDLAALITAVHRVGQKGTPVALICAGLPQLAGHLVQASSYAERLFRYEEIGSLDAEAARRALVVPAEREDVSWEADAVDFVINRTDRYPFFLQTYGSYAWRVARDTPISLTDVTNADGLAREQLDTGFHRARFNRATPAERRYLAAIAELGDGAQQTSEVSSALGMTQSQTAVQRQNLIDVKGLIYSPQRGFVDFTAPLFADYVRRHHPLESLV